MKNTKHLATIAFPLVAFGCSTGPASDGNMFATQGATSEATETAETTAVDESTESSTDTSSDTSSDASSDDGPVLDVANVETTGLEGLPCTKVDIVFVIDNSGSMADEQEALLAAFPEFASSMIDTLDTVTSLHVGVAASGVFENNMPGACAINGSLITKPMCTPFVDGNRFITEADDIVEAFACNASIGVGGDKDNTTMFNVASAVGDMDDPGECNEDFIRDDALLVIVLITDEEDDHDIPAGNDKLGSDGNPADWFDDVVMAKDGIEGNVVVASFVQPPQPNTCDGFNITPEGIEWFEANRIIEFTNSFTYSAVYDICDFPSYPDNFAEALGFIDEACDAFVPPD